MGPLGVHLCRFAEVRCSSAVHRTRQNIPGKNRPTVSHSTPPYHAGRRRNGLLADTKTAFNAITVRDGAVKDFLRHRFGDESLCELPRPSVLTADLVPGFESEDGDGELVFASNEHVTWFFRNVEPYRVAFARYMADVYGDITLAKIKEDLETGYSKMSRKFPTLKPDPFSFYDLWKEEKKKDSTTPAGTGK